MPDPQHTVEESFSPNAGNTKYNSELMWNPSSLDFATNIEPDILFESSSLPTQDNGIPLGDEEFDSWIDVSQFEPPDTRINQQVESIPRCDNLQEEPEKSDFELQKAEVDFKLRRNQLQRRRRDLRKMLQGEQQNEQLKQVEDDLEGVELELENIELLKQSRMIQTPRSPEEDQRSNRPGTQSFSYGWNGALVTTIDQGPNATSDEYGGPSCVSLPL